jgi:hypothetical protein
VQQSFDTTFNQTFSQLTAGAAETWLAVAYVLCMFAMVMFRPEHIRNASAFRISYIVFALYLIVPIAINSALVFSTALDPVQPRPGVGPSPGSRVVTTIVIQSSVVVGRLLLALSIVIGLSSLSLESAMSARPGNQPTA